MSSSNPRGARIAALVALAVAAGAGIAAVSTWRSGPAGRSREGAVGPGGTRPRTPGSLYAIDPYFDPAEAPATVEGLVVGSDVLPLDGATVALIRLNRRQQSTPSESSPQFDPAERPGDVARTSGSGRFRFEQVAAGSYLLATMADGRAPICVGPITLAPGETKTQTIRLLQPGGIALGGQVFAAHPGSAVAASRVRAIEQLPDRGAADRFARVFQTVADEAGKYEMVLDAGTYALFAEADGHVPARDWLHLTHDQTLDLHLGPASRLLGKVVERGSNKPIADADLWVLPQRPGASAPARDVHSDRIGLFAFNQLGPGSYRIGARKERLTGLSAPVTLLPGQSLSDVVVELAPGQAIAGRVVTMTGAPAPGAWIELLKAHTPAERPLFVAAGSDGRFLLEGLLPAHFRMVVTAAGMARSSQQLRLTGDLPSLEIKLHPEATVRGRVLTADHRPADGANVNLQVAPAPGSPATTRAFTITGADGTFTASGLPSGELTVRAQHPLHGLGVSRGQKLAEAERKSLSLTLDPGSSVAGTVKDPSGAAVAGVAVQISETAAGPPLWTDVTQTGGVFRLTGLPAGHFVLSASGTDQRLPLTVDGRSAKLGLSLVVVTAAPITGVIETPEGQPVAGAELTVQPEPPAHAAHDAGLAAHAFSGLDGRFTITPPTPGNQTLSVRSPAFADLRADAIAPGTTDLRLRFVPGGSCSGVVLGPDGQPVPHYAITVLAPPAAGSAGDARRPMPLATTPAIAIDTVHDASGRFALSDIPPGPHELRVTTAGGATASLVVDVKAGERKPGLRLVIGRDVAR
jgi:hypothetical protein